MFWECDAPFEGKVLKRGWPGEVLLVATMQSGRPFPAAVSHGRGTTCTRWHVKMPSHEKRKVYS